TPVAADAVGIASFVGTPPTEFAVGDTTITWTAIDTSGNTRIFVQTVTVVDSIAPEINGVANYSFEATATLSTFTVDTPVATDAVGIASFVGTPPTEFAVGDTTITWTAIDTSGNTRTFVQTVTVVDSTAPSISGETNFTIEAEGISTVFTPTAPTATDLVGVVSFTSNLPPVFPLGETLVTWIAIDGSANETTFIQRVMVIDSIAPSISGDANFLVEATGVETIFTPTTPDATDTVAIESLTNNMPAVFALGETLVTWTAVDTSGNANTFVQTIVVEDTTNPAITGTASYTIEASGVLTAFSVDSPSADDAVGIASFEGAPPTEFPLGATEITWTAIDTSGNSSTFVQTITVEDTTAPAITGVAAYNVEATGELTPVTVATPTESDAVGITSFVATPALPAEFSVGETVITWTAIDTSGNSSTFIQTITVTDSVAPEITGKAAYTLEASGITTLFTPDTPIATDIVGVSSLTNDMPASFPLGVTEVTWTAADASGNTRTFVQTITVQDTIAPVINGQANFVVEATGADTSFTPTTPVESDVVGIASFTNNLPATFPLGVSEVTWVATDSSGNSTSFVQTITVQDTTSPVFGEISPLLFEANAPSISPTIATPVVTDALGVTSITSDLELPLSIGQYTITWTARDAANNVATQTQLITVLDSASPSCDLPADFIAEAEGIESELNPTAPVCIDNVGILSLNHDHSGMFPLGETVINWTAIDTVGNEVSVAQSVIVVDTTAPGLTVPDDIRVETTADSIALDLGEAIADDAVEVVELSNDAPDLFPIGETEVTWTAIDSSGNETTAIQNVVVVKKVVEKKKKKSFLGSTDSFMLLAFLALLLFRQYRVCLTRHSV
ncbi:MAG: HYR domain-containing protein, partial [Gammaproteobacteria bacterium]|nr:HYR domain-containing protein [Gammaproteobacteria bacterium]